MFEFEKIVVFICNLLKKICGKNSKKFEGIWKNSQKLIDWKLELWFDSKANSFYSFYTKNFQLDWFENTFLIEEFEKN